MVVSVFEQVNSEFHHQSNHLVVHLCFFVHINSQVWLVSSKIHLLCIFEVSFALEFARFLNLNHGVLTFRQVPSDDLVGLVPFVCANIHLESLYEFTSVDEVLLGEVQLSHFSIMSCNLLEVGPCDFCLLVRH